MKDPQTGLCIWGKDPGPDPAEFADVPASFLERLDYFLTANLWVVPANISWADTKFKQIKLPQSHKFRRMALEDLRKKLKSGAQ